MEYLMNNPIPLLEVVDQTWLKAELEEWKGIQEMINESQQHSADKVIHRTWSNDIPYLRLYHTLVDDNIRQAFGEAYAVKMREELDGRNSGLYKSFYEKAVEKFNDEEWIPNSIVFPDLHEDFEKSKPLPLNVAPITAEQFKKNSQTIITKWSRSSLTGKGLDLVEGWSRTYKVRQAMMMTTLVSIMMAGNNQKWRFMNFGMVTIRNPSCRKGCHMYYIYGSYCIPTRF